MGLISSNVKLTYQNHWDIICHLRRLFKVSLPVKIDVNRSIINL